MHCLKLVAPAGIFRDDQGLHIVVPQIAARMRRSSHQDRISKDHL